MWKESVSKGCQVGPDLPDRACRAPPNSDEYWMNIDRVVNTGLLEKRLERKSCL